MNCLLFALFVQCELFALFAVRPVRTMWTVRTIWLVRTVRRISLVRTVRCSHCSVRTVRTSEQRTHLFAVRWTLPIGSNILWYTFGVRRGVLGYPRKNCFICRSHLTSFKRLKTGVISWLNVFRFWYFKILSQEASSWLLGWKKTNQMDSDEAQASQNKGGLGRMNQMDEVVADFSSNSLEQA